MKLKFVSLTFLTISSFLQCLGVSMIPIDKRFIAIESSEIKNEKLKMRYSYRLELKKEVRREKDKNIQVYCIN